MKKIVCAMATASIASLLTGCGGGSDGPQEEPVTVLDQVVTYSRGLDGGSMTASSIVGEFASPVYQRPAGKSVEVCADGVITQKLHQSGAFVLNVYPDYSGSPKNSTTTATGTAGVDMVMPFKVCSGSSYIGIELRAMNCGQDRCSGPFSGYSLTVRWTIKTVPGG